MTASSAVASTISVTTFSTADYQTKYGDLGGVIITETFADFAEMNVAGSGGAFDTQTVGTFQTLGGTGSGGTVKKADNTFTGQSGANPNDGSRLAIRDGDVFGRRSTNAIPGLAADDKFLDSNDTHGIAWDVDVGRDFRKILLTLTDGADAGATVRVSTVQGGLLTGAEFFQTQLNKNQKTVLIDFGALVQGARIEFGNYTDDTFTAYRANDGLSLDDIAVSAVPLPASFLLLGAALAGLGAVRRRKTAA
ncbi:MAG: VPLPA-CTERM sorting domain-containing protein [Pseudomonadota bacterium]